MLAFEHLQAIFNSSPIPTVVFSPSKDPVFLAANDAFLQVSTRGREELLGTRLFATFSGTSDGSSNPHVQALRDSISQAIETGKPHTMPAQHYPIKVKGADGHESFEDRYWNAVNTPIFDSGGQLIGVLHHTIDITHQVKAEEQERESSERLRLATDAAGLGIWSWDIVNDKAVWENDRMYELIGIAGTNEPVNNARFLSEIIHPDDAAPYRQAMTRTLESGGRFHFEGRFYRAPDRALRWIEFTGLLHLDVNGKPLRMVGTAADITERGEATKRLHNTQVQLEADIREKQRAEEEARRLAADLVKANQRQNEFLATLAHELRNPLAPIRTGLDLMRISPENAGSVTKIRETMERQVDHLIHLVNDLMDLARIQSGKIELKKSLVPLKDIVLNAIETSLPVIQAKHHDFSVQVPDEPIYLNADANRMAQVLGNLLTNAAKYTPENGRIGLLVQRAGDSAIIKVDDNGIGIPAEALPHLFQMFNQVHIGRDYAQGGLGIGLNLVKRLTEKHGGTVTAASAGTGQGSTFTLRLPIAQPEPAIVQISEVPAEGVTELTPLHILIADDNRDAAELLAQLLRSSGHVVQTAFDGASALAAAKALHPDLALLDIGMPGMNGYELAQAMRRVSALQTTVLVAITGWGSQEDRIRSREAGFAHHITKPVDLDNLNRLVSEVQNFLHNAFKKAPGSDNVSRSG